MADGEDATEQEIRRALDVVQSMIDISADRLEGLRTQCSTSAELTQQEIRTLEVTTLRLFGLDSDWFRRWSARDSKIKRDPSCSTIIVRRVLARSAVLFCWFRDTSMVKLSIHVTPCYIYSLTFSQLRDGHGSVRAWWNFISPCFVISRVGCQNSYLRPSRIFLSLRLRSLKLVYY